MQAEENWRKLNLTLAWKGNRKAEGSEDSI